MSLAGNHDHAATLEAYRPFAGAADITLVGAVRTAEQGGVIEFVARSGEPVTVAVLPFLSTRYAVRAAELITNTPGRAHRRLRPAAPGHPRHAHRRVPHRRGSGRGCRRGRAHGPRHDRR